VKSQFWKILSSAIAIGTIIIALLGLLAYFLNLGLLDSVKESYYPMAPATAICFIVLGVVTLYLNFKRPSNTKIFVLMMFTFLVSAFGILEVLGYFFGIDLNFEEIFVPTDETLNGIPLARMSPVTGVLFFLSGLSSYVLIIQKKHRSDNTYTEYFGSLLSIFVLLVGFIFCLAYLHGSPLLYGFGATVPMALTTSLGFIFLSLSTLTIEKEAFPLKLFTDGSTRSYLIRYFFPLLILSVVFGEVLSFLSNKTNAINPAFISALFTVLLITLVGFVATFVSRHIGREIDKSKADLKLANEKIVESESKFRNLYEKSSDAILIIENGKFIDCNEATLHMLKYKTKEDFLNVHPSVLSPKKQPDGIDSISKADKMMELAIKNGSHRFEWNHTRSNGEIFPAEVTLTYISGNNNNKIIHTVWRDITARKNAEKNIKRALLEGKESERNRISMDLHDGLGQILAATSMGLNSIEEEITGNSKGFTIVMKHIKNAIQECRNISHGLSSPLIKKYPLKIIINTLIDSFYARSDVQVNFEFQIKDCLSDFLNTQVYRIYQEVLNNSVKHSKATTIFLSLKKHNFQQIELIYEDDGIGFELNKVKTGIGLKNMEARVKALNGQIKIITFPNKGTRYEIYLPIDEN